jgi:carbonic anhydrase
MSGSAAGVASATILNASSFPSHALAAAQVTAEEALANLKAGNAKFVSAPEQCISDVGLRRAGTAAGQTPWATILTCSDSRVAPELVFGGTNLGDLFVARNAGNTADAATLGTLEYAAEHLGVPLIVVLGHERCGAVAAACDVVEKHTTFPGFMAPMVDAIVPAARAVYGQPGDFVDNAVRENAKRVAAQISSQSALIKHLAEAGKVKIVYARYDLDSGVVDFLG